MILNVGFNTFKSWFLLIATETATSNSFLFGESLQGGQIEIFLLTLWSPYEKLLQARFAQRAPRLQKLCIKPLLHPRFFFFFWSIVDL